MSDEMLGDQPAWTDEDQAAFEAEDTRDCTAWLELLPELAIVEGPRSAAECAVIGPHTTHAGLSADGDLVRWTDATEGARRG